MKATLIVDSVEVRRTSKEKMHETIIFVMQHKKLLMSVASSLNADAGSRNEFGGKKAPAAAGSATAHYVTTCASKIMTSCMTYS